MKIFIRATGICLVVCVTILSGCVINDNAEKRFHERTAPFSVTVYPVNVYWRDTLEHNPECVPQIVEFLEKEHLAQPLASKDNAQYDFKWSRIQSTMARHSGLAFAEFVKKQNIETDYALLVDVLMTKSGRSVAGVHIYLVERGGLVASFGLTNSKWEEFQQVRPTSKEKGVLISTMMMKRLWKQ